MWPPVIQTTLNRGEAEMPRLNSPRNNPREMMCRLSSQATVAKMLMKATCRQTANEMPQKPSWHLWHKTEAMLLKQSLLAKVTIWREEPCVIVKADTRCNARLLLLCIGVLCFLLLLTCSDCMTGIEEVRVWAEWGEGHRVYREQYFPCLNRNPVSV